jgi:probable HAF family extracellular repeat protein
MSRHFLPHAALAAMLGCSPTLFADTAIRVGAPEGASFQGLGDLPGGSFASIALGVSGDGRVIVGYGRGPSGDEASAWRDGRLIGLGVPAVEDAAATIAHDASRDGSVIVGDCACRGGARAFRWQNGTMTLLPADGAAATTAWAVSADGATVVGGLTAEGTARAAIWRQGQLAATDGAGAVFLREARDVSADGTVVVGALAVDGERAGRLVGGRLDVIRTPEGRVDGMSIHAVSADGSTTVGAADTRWGREAFRADRGPSVGLGGLSTGHELFAAARGVSANGSVVVGTSEGLGGAPEAFVWTSADGMWPLRELLSRRHGLDLTGWTLAEATAVADDGRTIVGYGVNPQGDTEAWVAHLPPDGPAPQVAPLGFDRLRAMVDAGVPGLRAPSGVAIDRQGQIVVADTGHDRICVFDAAGRRRRCFTASAGDPPRLSRPTAVAVGEDGALVVLDSGHDRVVTYAADGTPQLALGARGAGVDHLRDPRGLAVSRGRIAVADTGSDRVVIFGLDGQSPTVLGRSGGGPGELRGPAAVAFDDVGRLWAADTDNHRVQAFGTDGRPHLVVGGPGRGPGTLRRPTAVAWAAGVIHVVDDGGSRTPSDHIEVLAASGQRLGAWGRGGRTPHEGGGRLAAPGALAVSPDGTWAVVCEPAENRCQVLERGPATAGTWTPPAADDDVGEQLAVDGHLLSLLRPARDGVDLFDLAAPGEPRLLATAGRWGNAGGQLIRPRGVALDLAHERWLVSDAGNRRLVLFSLPPGWLAAAGSRAAGVPPPTAPFLRAVSTSAMAAALDSPPGGPELLPSEPGALAVDPDGTVYMVDTANRVVLALDRHLAPIRAYAPAGGGEPFVPTDLAVDAPRDRLFILDGHARRVAVFARDGQPQGTFMLPATATGDAPPAWGLTVDDGDGSLWAVDDAPRLLHLDARGGELGTFGRAGVGPAEMTAPRDVAMTGAGQIAVLDWGNRRVITLSRGGEQRGVLGAGPAAHAARWAPPVAGAPFEVASAAGSYVVELAPPPAELPLNEPFNLWVRVLDAGSRQPLTGRIELTVDAQMPAHGHGMTTRPLVIPGGDGSFLVRGLQLHMVGDWRLDVDITRDGTTERAEVPVALD